MNLDIVAELKAQEAATARKHFKKLGVPCESEVDLLPFLDDQQETETVVAAIVLIGSPPPEEAISRLKSLSTHRAPGIRTSAFGRVAEALKERGTDFYCECLNHPMFREKSAAVYCIWRYGDNTAIESLIKRLRQIVNTRKGSVPCFANGESELTQCLDYLHPHRDRQDVQKIFQRLVDKWEILDRKEAWWITDQLPFFKHEDLIRSDHATPAVRKLTEDGHPIFTSCSNGDIDFVRDFLRNGMSVYSCTESKGPLASIAIETGNLEMLQLLVEYGLDIERPTHGFHEWPIVMALRTKQEGVADYILDQHIDLNRHDEYGFTIFMIASCGIASPAQLQRMIALGGNVRERRYRGLTPFIQAARGEALELMPVLLKAGAHIDEADNAGKTALIHCAQGGQLSSVQWLIQHGANAILSEHGDQDALYWARHNNHVEIIDLLKSHLDGR